MSNSTHAPTTGELKMIPIDRIRVVDNFNHRNGGRDPDKFALMVASIRSRGVQKTLLVTPPDADGIHDLVSGETRLAAAKAAGLTEVPCQVRAAATMSERHIDALVENLTQQGLNVLEEARAYQQMRQERMSIAAIAEKLGSTITAARVRDRLRLLDLPESVQQLVADGTVPLRAVRTLADIARVDAELCETVVRALREEQTAQDPYVRAKAWTWGDVARRTNEVLESIDPTTLPDHVFTLGVRYSLSRFQLDGDAQRALEELMPDPIAREHAMLEFSAQELEQARVIRAAYGPFIVGVDAASAILSSTLRQQLARKREEEAQRAARAAAFAAAQAAADQQPSPATDTTAGDDGDTAEEEKSMLRALFELEADLRELPVSDLEDVLSKFRSEHGHDSVPRRLENIANRRLAAAARSYNEQLGIAVLREFQRVDVDERAIKIISAFDIHGRLADLAMRGARYCLPGWATVTTTRTGREKVTYPEIDEACDRARDFLAGAEKPGELLGRQLALLILARLADQRAVARSNRWLDDAGVLGYLGTYQTWGVETGLPWAEEVNDLLMELALERLPDHLMAEHRAEHEKRLAARAEAEAAHRQAEQEFAASLHEMDPAQIPAALDQFLHQHGVLDVEIEELARELAARAAPAETDSPSDAQPSERDPVAA